MKLVAYLSYFIFIIDIVFLREILTERLLIMYDFISSILTLYESNMSIKLCKKKNIYFRLFDGAQSIGFEKLHILKGTVCIC